MMDRNLFCCIWLSLCFRPGSDKLDRVVREYEPEEFYDHWRECSYLSPADRRRLEGVSELRGKPILATCEKKKIDLLPITDERYPECLRQVFSPPPVLYLRGNWKEIFDRPMLTVVGTRQSNSYTDSITGNISYQLAKAGITIVSGCAAGIDAAAMTGALKAGGRVIGVTHGGVDTDYPAATRKLKEAVCRKGALISELPPGTGITPWYIPQRNRLMAGLGEGVFVTHAPLKSGSLITAHTGVDLGKSVYALAPFDVYDANCLGTASLLREGAKPVFSSFDILEDFIAAHPDLMDQEKMSKYEYLLRGRPSFNRRPFGMPKSAPAKKQEAPAPQPEEEPTHAVSRQEKPQKPATLTPNQALLFDALDLAPKHVEQLRQETGLSAQLLLTTLTELELLGLVVFYPGQKYALSTK